jgi:hypothetical protein
MLSSSSSLRKGHSTRLPPVQWYVIAGFEEKIARRVDSREC